MPLRPPRHKPVQRVPDSRPRRPSPSRRGYGQSWRRLSLMFRRSQPLCADPFGIHASEGRQFVAGEHVDHIKPLRAGGTNEWSNLQTLCASCHSRKTVLEDGGFGRPKTPQGDIILRAHALDTTWPATHACSRVLV